MEWSNLKHRRAIFDINYAFSIIYATDDTPDLYLKAFIFVASRISPSRGVQGPQCTKLPAMS